MEALRSALSWLGLEVNTWAAIRVCVALFVGGFLGLYIRFLYKTCARSPASQEIVANVLPLLTLITVVVIAVVKSSLALSLGLVGALSIVRFRAAIKDPEELAYLFMAIAVGLAIGAGKPVPAAALVFVASVFLFGQKFLVKGGRRHDLLLTISGDAKTHFDQAGGVLGAIQEVGHPFTLQRYEVEEEQGTVRVVVNRIEGAQVPDLVARLRARLPGCRVSYVNMDDVF